MSIYRRFWPVLYLLLITGIVYNTVLLPGQTLLPADMLLLTPPWRHHAQELLPGFHYVQRPAWDPIFQFYPARKFLADSLHVGHIPLWNSLAFSGTPFVGDNQSAVFYPINWLFAILPLPSAFGWIAALHTFLTGLFFYAYTRRLRLGKIASLCGATAWMLCGVLIVWQMWQVVDGAICWLPLALYFWEGYRATGDRRQAAGMGIALGFSLLAGHLQFSFYVCLTSMAYALFRPLPRERSSFASSVAALAGVLVLAISIAAVQLFLTADLLLHSERTQSTYALIQGLCMPVKQLGMLLTPDLLGGLRDWTKHPYVGGYNYYELTAYCGAAAFAFGLYGLRLKPRGDLSQFWFGLMIFALLMACGSPLLEAFYYGVPLFKSFHGPARILVLLDFAIAALCAQGVERLIQTPVAERSKMAGYVSIGVGMVVLLGYRFEIMSAGPDLSQRLTHEWLSYGLTQVGIALLAAGVACVLLAKAPAHFAWLALPLVAADMIWFAVGINVGVPSTLLYASTPETRFVSDHLGDSRVLCLGDDNPNDQQSRLVPNSPMALGWRDISGSDPLILSRYDEFIGALNKSSVGAPAVGEGMVAAAGSPMLDRLNVKYIVTPRLLSQPDYVLAFEGDVNVYENTKALGAARLEHDWRVIGETSGTPMELFSSGRTGILLNQQPPLLSTIPTVDPEAVRVVKNRSGEILVDATARRPSVLVTQETFDPGWKAIVDGRPSPTLVADTVFLAVPLPPGEHKVTLRFLPSVGLFGLYLTCSSWGLIAWLMAGLRRSVTLRTNGKHDSNNRTQ